MTQQSSQYRFRRFPDSVLRICRFVIYATSLSLACFVASSQVGQVAVSQTSQTPFIPKPQPRSGVVDPSANRPPDANDLMVMREQQIKRQAFAAANLERSRQLKEDAVLLLKLANELKAELAKSSEGTLSLSSIRKADDIERLAHNVQLKMKLTVGIN